MLTEPELCTNGIPGNLYTYTF